jgi:hypothetical protein
VHSGLEPVADAEPYANPEAEPVAEPYVDPGAEPDAAVSMTDGTAVGVGRLLALLIEEWGTLLAVVGLS